MITFNLTNLSCPAQVVAEFLEVKLIVRMFNDILAASSL